MDPPAFERERKKEEDGMREEKEACRRQMSGEEEGNEIYGKGKTNSGG